MSQQRVAGRELDAEIAERVMGWEFFACGYYGTEEETPRMRELDPWLERVGIESVGDYYIDVASDFVVEADDFQPSTDIAAAWLVVEKMRADKYALMFESDWPPEHDFIARFERDPSGLAKYEHADTAPLAICLAALAAMPDKPTGTADADGPVPNSETLTNSSLVSHHREDEPR